MKKIIPFLILISIANILFAQDSLYKLGSDSYRKEGVPKGVVSKYEWQSKIYNNFREYYVYVPTQYNDAIPSALMVFQDGHSYVSDSGDQRVCIVYDNLIHQKKYQLPFVYLLIPGIFLRTIQKIVSGQVTELMNMICWTTGMQPC